MMDELPLGFAMALPQGEQQQLLREAHQVQSRQEMRSLVKRLEPGC